MTLWGKNIPVRGKIWKSWGLSRKCLHLTGNAEGNMKWSEVKVAQSCLTLCDPMDYTVHGILQARILEWVAFPFSRDLPNPGIKPRSPALKADSLPAEPQRSLRILQCLAYPFSSRSEGQGGVKSEDSKHVGPCKALGFYFEGDEKTWENFEQGSKILWHFQL